MTALIVSHTWRPPLSGNRAIPPFAQRPCEYMNCRRPRAEHARHVTRRAQR